MLQVQTPVYRWLVKNADSLICTLLLRTVALGIHRHITDRSTPAHQIDDQVHPAVLFDRGLGDGCRTTPLITEDIETVKPGSVSFGGFDFLQDKSYGLSGLNGDLTRLG
jgi:hypothetical protein